MLLLFSLHKKIILVALLNYNWTTDVTWTILPMSLLSFCALIVVISLLSMEGHSALSSIKTILICVPKMNECLTGLEGHEGE